MLAVLNMSIGHVGTWDLLIRENVVCCLYVPFQCVYFKRGDILCAGWTKSHGFMDVQLLTLEYASSCDAYITLWIHIHHSKDWIEVTISVFKIRYVCNKECSISFFQHVVSTWDTSGSWSMWAWHMEKLKGKRIDFCQDQEPLRYVWNIHKPQNSKKGLFNNNLGRSMFLSTPWYMLWTKSPIIWKFETYTK